MGLSRIGALWAREKDGKRYLSGELELVRGGEKIRVMVFKNEDKEGRQPDYRIMRQDDDETQARPAKEEKQPPFPMDDETKVPF